MPAEVIRWHKKVFCHWPKAHFSGLINEAIKVSSKYPLLSSKALQDGIHNPLKSLTNVTQVSAGTPTNQSG